MISIDKINLPGEKEKYVHSVFAAIADRYDFLNTALSFNQDKYWRRFAVKQAALPVGGRGLDVCCGTGMLSIELAKSVQGAATITGLDFSEEMLAVGRNNVNQSGFADAIELLQGNAMKLPFADNTFDCATIGFALRNVPDIKQVISEMRRVVKPGGRVVSLELAKPSVFGFKQLYYLYFEQLLPLLGKLGVGVDGPYRWLPESLRRFPHQQVICDYFREIGLRNARYDELTGGIVAVHVGVK